MESLSQDVLRHIATSLTQRDCIALQCASKYLYATVSPRHVEYAFKRSSTVQDYERFVRWVADPRRDIESIHVLVDCAKWNPVASRLFGSAESVPSVFLGPLTNEEIFDTPWFPTCESRRSGFMEPNADVIAHVSRTSISLISPLTYAALMPTHAKEAPELPVMGKGVHTVACLGTFRGIRNISTAPTTTFAIENAALDGDDLEHLQKFTRALSILRCTLPSASKFTLAARSVWISYTMLLHVQAAPQCKHMTVYLQGPLADKFPVFPDVETLTLAGYCYDAAQAMDFAQRAFPGRCDYTFTYQIVTPE